MVSLRSATLAQTDHQYSILKKSGGRDKAGAWGSKGNAGVERAFK